MRPHILLLPDTQDAFTSQKNRVKAHEKQLWPARSQQQEPPCAIFPPPGCFLWFQGKQAIRFIRQAAPTSGSTALSRQANSLPASRRIRAGRQHARCSPSAQSVPGTGTLLTTGETALPRRRAAGQPIRTTFPGQPAHSPQRPEDGRRGYRMLQLRIICSAVLFSTLRSMSSGRLQKKSMPVRPSSSLMLTT